MDRKTVYPTEVYSYQGSSEPSAPPIPSPNQAQTVVVPIPQYTEYVYRDSIRRRNTDGNHFPINASLFLLGLFFFPPLWFVGWCCWNSPDKYEKAWRKLNIWMSIIFIILIILVTIVFTILGIEELDHDSPNNEDPSWRLPPSLYFIQSLLF